MQASDDNTRTKLKQQTNNIVQRLDKCLKVRHILELGATESGQSNDASSPQRFPWRKTTESIISFFPLTFNNKINNEHLPKFSTNFKIQGT